MFFPIMVSQPSQSVLPVIFPFAFIDAAVFEHQPSFSVEHIVFPFALILGAAVVEICSLTLFFVFYEVSGIDISVRVNNLPVTIPQSVFPGAFINDPIGIDAFPLTVEKRIRYFSHIECPIVKNEGVGIGRILVRLLRQCSCRK
ncbi:MAG: hypothetical protein BWY95_00900 [Bacteroidetes bacterium ADurb.BinA104]|nr:MAG: hypothetical protein BWY95_00900 [Bacteroidetes bacterium ADurb.BinA104]